MESGIGDVVYRLIQAHGLRVEMEEKRSLEFSTPLVGEAVLVQLARSSLMARWKVFRRSVLVPAYGSQSGWVSSIVERGRQDGPEASRELEGQPFGDEGIGAQRQMRTMMIESADRKDESRVPLQKSPYLRPREVVQPT